MGQPSTQNFVAGFDPTGYVSISGAALLQLINLVTLASDKGISVTTTDVAGVPQVPNASVTTAWQRYSWLRISPTTNSVGLYLWNPGAPSDATFLLWQPAFQASIPAASIQGYQIAPNTIVDANIAGINWSKISGAPTTFTPSGAAGGDLTGTYPNPSVASLAITSAKIALNNVKGGASNQLATGANGVDITQNIAVPAASTLSSPAGSSAGVPLANDRLVVGVGATAYATVRKVIDGLAEPAGGDALKVVQVNSGGTGFQYTTANGSALGRILQVVQTLDKTADSTVLNTALTAVPTTSTAKLPAGLTAAITPLSASSTLLVEMVLNMNSSNSADSVIAVLFQDSGANAIAAASCNSDVTSRMTQVTLRYSVASGSLTARTFKAGFCAVSGTARYNSTDGSTVMFGGTLGVFSAIRITEYI